MATKYCSYIRVSTKRQGDSGLGLEAQQQIIEHFYPGIENEFIEVKSGKNIQSRPVLLDCIKWCLDNDAHMVVAKVDRLTRDAKDGLTILEMLKGRILFCDIPGVPDKFMLTLFLAIAERERLLISIRTKGALTALKGRGKQLGVNNPSGNRRAWTAEISQKGADARREEARLNQNNIRAFTMAKEMLPTSGYVKIAAKLNEAGFATPSGRGKWNHGSVYRLVQRSL